jgi:uncharacterized protein YbaA (DUF1428 family)
MNKTTRKKLKVGYIDGFVLVVPKKRVAEYIKMADEAGRIWMKCGALSYKECVGDDLKPDMGGYPFLWFSKMTKLKASETVWFSYIEYKSKVHRDSVNRKVMKVMKKLNKDTPDHMEHMPFDMKHFAYAGFSVKVIQ